MVTVKIKGTACRLYSVHCGNHQPWYNMTSLALAVIPQLDSYVPWEGIYKVLVYIIITSHLYYRLIVVYLSYCTLEAHI